MPQAHEDLLGSGATHVYTGDGKGKTTAALGLAMRAVGWGLRVLMIQFMKRWGYGEHRAALRLAPQLEILQVGVAYLVADEADFDSEILEKIHGEVKVFPPGCPPEELVEQADKGMRRAERAFEAGSTDILILDEVNMAVHFGLIPLQRVLDLISSRPRGVELVLTGRRAPHEIIEAADLVTEMRETKHYWSEGLQARRGIEE